MLRIFTYTKNRLDPDSEYALVLLSGEAIWYYDFEPSASIFYNQLSSVQPQGRFDTFNLGSLFVALNGACPDILSDDSDFIYRTMILYTRSKVLPFISKTDTEISQNIMTAPNFYLDTMYIHSKASKGNNVQEIFDYFTDLNPSRRSYTFETSAIGNKRFFVNTTCLLSHPTKRPINQEDFKTLSIK
eukprot:TRINITY_DN4342_c0_g1_i1.p1 TRINITY_DN4342_c0_g1~~TRINITY_DN4342_c0_g1_i1.p1  ORF type:complete len:187 (-),score=20.47 TRINITY_DN4342_c0_g1_i1:100-660(-)